MLWLCYAWLRYAMAFLNVVRLGLQIQTNFTNKLGYSYKFIQAEICFNLHLVIFR